MNRLMEFLASFRTARQREVWLQHAVEECVEPVWQATRHSVSGMGHFVSYGYLRAKSRPVVASAVSQVLRANLPAGTSASRMESLRHQMTEEAVTLVAERLVTKAFAQRSTSGRQLRRAA